MSLIQALKFYQSLLANQELLFISRDEQPYSKSLGVDAVILSLGYTRGLISIPTNQRYFNCHWYCKVMRPK